MSTGTLSRVLDNAQNSYFSEAFRPPMGLKRRAKRDLEEVDFDTFVVTGISGALVVAELAHHLHKNFAVVRKTQTESSHASRKIEGCLGSRWIFLDDFISSGATLQRVINEVEDFVTDSNRWRTDYETPLFESHIVGTYTYQRQNNNGCGFRKISDYSNYILDRSV